MGAKIDGLEKLTKQLDKIAVDANMRYRTDVGFFAKDKYPDGTPVAAVAEQNEFGNPAKNIPARPFMRQTVENKKAQWVKELTGLLGMSSGDPTAVLTVGNKTGEVMGLMGADMTYDIKDTISKKTTPPLAKKTVAEKRKKGSRTPDKPLQDTRLMYDSVTHVESND